MTSAKLLFMGVLLACFAGRPEASENAIMLDEQQMDEVTSGGEPIPVIVVYEYIDVPKTTSGSSLSFVGNWVFRKPDASEVGGKQAVAPGVELLVAAGEKLLGHQAASISPIRKGDVGAEVIDRQAHSMRARDVSSAVRHVTGNLLVLLAEAVDVKQYLGPRQALLGLTMSSEAIPRETGADRARIPSLRLCCINGSRTESGSLRSRD